MADIGNEIDAIRGAKYGEEVRGEIADALEAMNVQAAAAQEWATGEDDPTAEPSATNNAAYWAAQAAASAGEVPRFEKNVFQNPISYGYISNPSLWTIGSGVRPSDGANQTIASQCRTPYNTIKGVTLLYIDDVAYEFVVWEYATDSATSALFSPRPAFSDAPVIITEEQGATKFRVGVKRKDGANITSADTTTLAAKVKTFTIVDTTLTQSGVPADAKKVGDELSSVSDDIDTLQSDLDSAEKAIMGTLSSSANSSLWEVGSFNSSTGTEYPSENSKRLRTKENAQFLCAVKTTSTYRFSLYAWDNAGTYIGTLQSDGTYEKTSPAYFADIVLDPTNEYSYRILLKRNDEDTIDVSESANVTIETSIPPRNKQDIAEIKQAIEPLLLLTPGVFPQNGKKENAVDFYDSFDALADWQEITENEFYEYGMKSGGYVDSHITDYQNYELRAYYLNGRMEYMGYNGAGQTPSTNYYKLLSPYTDDDHAEAVGTGLYQRKKALIVAGMHGDEGATPNVLREFVRNLINNPNYADILTAYEFCFIPLANPYGYSIDRRDVRYYDPEAGDITTMDMNHDFPQDGSSQITNEAKFVENIFLNGEYDLVIDLHQHNFDAAQGSTSVKLAFGGVTVQPESSIDTSKYYAMISGKAVQAENDVRTLFNISDNTQTMFAWDRDTTHTLTFREYAVGTRDASARHKAQMAAISETSTCCHYYTDNNVKYNQTAMTVCNVFDDAIISGVLREFIKETL